MSTSNFQWRHDGLYYLHDRGSHGLYSLCQTKGGQTKKDFEPSNRKQFCSRIATGDYDAIVIGHSQFERVPLSPERQKAIVERQIDDITLALADARSEDSRSFTVKQMEKTKKTLEAKLQKLKCFVTRSMMMNYGR